jgi:hypothetical protein
MLHTELQGWSNQASTSSTEPRNTGLNDKTFAANTQVFYAFPLLALLARLGLRPQCRDSKGFSPALGSGPSDEFLQLICKNPDRIGGDELAYPLAGCRPDRLGLVSPGPKSLKCHPYTIDGCRFG